MFRSSTIIYILVLQPTELTRGRFPLRQRRHATLGRQTPSINHSDVCYLLCNKDFVINCDNLLLTYSFCVSRDVLDRTLSTSENYAALVNNLCMKFIWSCP